MRRAALWALLGALWVWGLPGGAGGCVLCDPAAGAALGQLLGPFLARALPREPEQRGRLGSLVLRALLALGRLPRDPRSFMGVIDQPTLEEASANFRRTLARVMAQDLQDQQMYQELLWALREIKEDFERIMRRFQSQVYCPNKCGRMEVLWIECISCNLTRFACNRGLDCGERQLWVEEGQDLVLDCALPWHGASHGAKTYSFYQGLAPPAASPEPPEPPPQSGAEPPGAGVAEPLEALEALGPVGAGVARPPEPPEPPEPPGAGVARPPEPPEPPEPPGAGVARPPEPPGPAERLLRSGPAALLVRKEAAAAAGGRYRCVMRGPAGREGSELRFSVTVLPRPRVPGEAPPPPRAPPAGLPPAAIAAIAVTTVATALLAAGTAWFCLRRGTPGTPPQIKES